MGDEMDLAQFPAAGNDSFFRLQGKPKAVPVLQDHPLSDDPDFKHLVALDCEMVKTAIGPEVVRVSIVDTWCEVLLDEFCQPKRPVIDYLTKFSGIDEKTLKEVTTSLEEVQKKVKSILTQDTIIVGHGLHNDLIP